MGKSSVLRNESGKAVGYIQHAGDILRCGIQDPEEQVSCDLYLMDDIDNVHIKRISGCQREYEWHDVHGRIVGGCVVIDGKILADTGKEVRRGVHVYMRRKDAVQERKAKREVQAENRTNKKENVRYPQRSWPPNPCCPEAVLESKEAY